MTSIFIVRAEYCGAPESHIYGVYPTVELALARIAVLEGEDFFFDGAGGDEFVARDDARLADAVGAVGGLRFG
ncbi:MAG: hypothetical protein EBY81_05440, partial [Verrucomicrobia bacterium]|nr:hypothetical protein [Verrucomicrobiota bacterium]